jgi:hypothetical protein
MLAKCLDVNAAWLWTGKGNPDGELSNEEARLVAAFRLLPLDRQSILLQMASTMTEGDATPRTPINPQAIRAKRN